MACGARADIDNRAYSRDVVRCAHHSRATPISARISAHRWLAARSADCVTGDWRRIGLGDSARLAAPVRAGRLDGVASVWDSETGRSCVAVALLAEDGAPIRMDPEPLYATEAAAAAAIGAALGIG
jgi:hypothetical protein